MSSVLVDAGIVLGLIFVGAVFVAAEIALISLREGQVKALATQGRRGAIVARLIADPNRFLAAVQIGVTLAGFLSSAFGAITLSKKVRNSLVDLGVSSGLAGFVGVVGVTLLISFISLVIGELAPKRLALQRPESTARLIAPFLDAMATLVRPVIWLLSKSTDLVVRLLGGDPGANRESITEQELRDLVAAHEALSPDKRGLIDEVFAAGERQISEVMVPRTEVDFLEASTTFSRAARMAMEAPRSRYPVIDRNQDDVIGFVHIRDLLDPRRSSDRTVTVRDVVRMVKRLPASKKVLAALSEMRREGQHLAIVIDEYGGTDGIVTLEDLIEELIGDIRDEYDIHEVESRRFASGDVEVDGLLNLDEFAEFTGIELPDGPYETVGGFIMRELGRLPKVGDTLTVQAHDVVVVAMDARRVARLRVSPSAQAGASATSVTP